VASTVDAALKAPDCLLDPDDPTAGPGSPGGKPTSRGGGGVGGGGGGLEPGTGGSVRSRGSGGLGGGSGGGGLEPHSGDRSAVASLRQPASSSSGGGGGGGAGGGGEALTPAAVLAMQKAGRILASPELVQRLHVAERAVMQLAFQGAQLRCVAVAVAVGGGSNKQRTT
jgi:hypothetical protein